MSETMDIVIRRAARDEMNAVRALTRRAYQPWVAVLGREPLPMSADYAAAFELHRFDVIDAEAGICALIETQLRADSLWIENIAVDPAAQGKGYGRVLFGHAEQLARECGLGRLTLYTNKLMKKNIAIYSARGYTIDKEERLEHAVAVHMSKVLD